MEGAREGGVGGAREGGVGGAREGGVEGAREGGVGGAREGVVGGAREGGVEGAREGGVEGAREGGVEGWGKGRRKEGRKGQQGGSRIFGRVSLISILTPVGWGEGVASSYEIKDTSTSPSGVTADFAFLGFQLVMKYTDEATYYYTHVFALLKVHKIKRVCRSWRASI